MRRLWVYFWCMVFYAWVTTKHKWYVVITGRRCRVSWYRILVHDLSKFRPSELLCYGRQFFATDSDFEPTKLEWSICWNHHQKHNDHHWEYWHLIGSKGTTILDMPDEAIREMIADWLAASKAYEGNWPKSVQEWGWYQKHILLFDTWFTPNTVKAVKAYINLYFTEGYLPKHFQYL